MNGAKEDSKDTSEQVNPDGKAAGEAKASSKTYTEEEFNKALNDKVNAELGKKGWDFQKIQEEIQRLKDESETYKIQAREAELKSIATEYDIPVEKIKELGYTDPEDLRKALKITEVLPAKSANFKPDSGKSVGGSGIFTRSQIANMSEKEYLEHRDEIWRAGEEGRIKK